MNGVVKICGLSDAPTLAAALDAGADMVGFVFFPPSPRHLDLGRARALGRQAKGRAQKVALTVDASDAELEAIVAALAPDELQLHGAESPARVALLRARFGLPVMKAVGLRARADLDAVAPFATVADRLLFDAKPPAAATRPGGNGEPFDWALLRGFDIERPWMLSGGLTGANVAQAVRVTGARSVDASSGLERAPGVKDEGLIGAFVARARTALSNQALALGREARAP